MLKVVMQGLAVGSEWWWSCESFKGPAKVHQTTSRPAGGSNTAEKLLGRVVLSSLVRELRGLRERTTSTQQLLTPPHHLNQSKVLVIITRQTVTRRFPLHLHLRAKALLPATLEQPPPATDHCANTLRRRRCRACISASAIQHPPPAHTDRIKTLPHFTSASAVSRSISTTLTSN